MIDETELLKRWQWYIKVESEQASSSGTDPMSQEYLKGKLAAWKQAVEELKDISRGEDKEKQEKELRQFRNEIFNELVG